MASDGEAVNESSNELQQTEAMTDVASSLLGKKRKIETTNPEDSDESEGDGESDSDWDKDSFDGREYNPADDDGYYMDRDLEKMIRFYNRTVIETKGFFEPSDDFPPNIWAGISTIWDLEEEVKQGITCREFLASMTSLCLDKYNRRKERNVKFEHIVRANYNPGGRTKYYITFAARESESLNEPLVEYQAKAVWVAGETYPILCRPTSPHKTVGKMVEEIN